jgi:hypothetical protein
MDKLYKFILSLFITGNVTVATPTFQPTPIPQTTFISQSSPDGKENLNMSTQIINSMATYSFTSNKINFTRIDNEDVKVTIPFNTWSNDNKSVFIKEDLGETANYWIYPVGINLTDFFKEKLPDLKLTDVTGWAAPNLLIVNTNKSNNDKASTYWFDTVNHNFIQLSNRFE